MATIKSEEAQELKAVIEAGFEDNNISNALKTERERWLLRHRGAVVSQNVTVHHPMVERAFKRDFEKMSQYLYFIPVFGRILLKGSNQKEIVKIETHVLNSIVKNTKHIDHLIRQANVTFMKFGNEIPSTFSGGSQVQAPLTSPLSRIYLEMLQRADNFLMLMSTMWISGMLDDDFNRNEEQRSQLEMEIKRLIASTNMSILNQHRSILNRLRRQARDDRSKSDTNKPDEHTKADPLPGENDSSASKTAVEPSPVAEAA